MKKILVLFTVLLTAFLFSPQPADAQIRPKVKKEVTSQLENRKTIIKNLGLRLANKLEVIADKLENIAKRTGFKSPELEEEITKSHTSIAQAKEKFNSNNFKEGAKSIKESHLHLKNAHKILRSHFANK